MARILIIDDEEQIRNTLRVFLERAGHEVLLAPDGRDVDRLIAARPVDLVITDIIMPGKEGIETIIDLRRSWPETKIIAMSGSGRARKFDVLEVAEKLGATHTLRKPFRPRQMLALVERCLRDADGRPA